MNNKHITPIPADNTLFEQRIAAFLNNINFNDFYKEHSISESCKTIDDIMKIIETTKRSSSNLYVDYDSEKKSLVSLRDFLEKRLPVTSRRVDVDIYKFAGELMNPNSPKKAASDSRNLRNWNDFGAKFTRADSYELLIRLLFALSLSYDDCIKFMDNIGAKHLYPLDCHEHILILAIKYNEISSEKVSYSEALEIAKKSDEYIKEEIEEQLRKVASDHPEMNKFENFIYALRSMYVKARTEARSLNYINDDVTMFTSQSLDNIFTLLSGENDLSFEELSKKSVRQNTCQMLRMRKNLLAIMTEYFCGSRDFTNITPEKCIWLNNDSLANIKKIENEQLLSYLFKKFKIETGTSIISWLNSYIIDPNKSVLGEITDIDIPSLILANSKFLEKENLKMHEDNIVSILHNSKVKSLTSTFSTSLTSFITGRIKESPNDHRLSRKQLLIYCAQTGKITRMQVNKLLEASGEPPLSGSFPDDYNMIAVVRFTEWIAEHLFDERLDDKKFRKIYQDYLKGSTLFDSVINDLQ